MKRKSLSPAVYSNKRLKRDKGDSKDTATDSPLCDPDYRLLPSAQEFDGGFVYPSIEIPLEDPQTAQRDLICAPRPHL
jgi:hypothetical protein